jgi:hypothetical protein
MPTPTRTPEGEPLRCQICGAVNFVEPSRPPGDAICPYCGTLAWMSTDRAAASGGRVAPGSQRLGHFLRRSAVQPTPPACVPSSSQWIGIGAKMGLATVAFFFVWYASLLICALYAEGYSNWVNSDYVRLIFPGGLLLVLVGCLASLVAIFGGAISRHTPAP